MAVEGVIVTYNYSESDEHPNTITVAASGIKFSNRWVLTHGSILSPLQKSKASILNGSKRMVFTDEFYETLPDMYVSCEVRKNDYNKIGSASQESFETEDLTHTSYIMRVLTGRVCHAWQCPMLDRCVDDNLYSWTIGHRVGDVEKQTKLGKALFSVFLLIDLESEDSGYKTWRPLSELLELVSPPPGRGSTIEIHSTPFGCEVFLNSMTFGTVCGVVGEKPSLLLTDAVTALGSEGGPVFTEGTDKKLIGVVVCSVSWRHGEWVGLTLVAPLLSVLATKLHVHTPSSPRKELSQTLKPILHAIDSITVLVRCGSAWGSGVYLGRGYILTCAHVVKNYATYKVSIYSSGIIETGIVKFHTNGNKAYDLALVFISDRNWNHLKPAKFSKETPKKGMKVLAAGYPYFNENDLQNLRPMMTSGHINNASPSIIQTSCCVQSGYSGGPILRITKDDGVEVLGVIVSNAKTINEACHPYINMAVPARAFIPLMQHFLIDKDITKLREIENKRETIQSQWQLLPYRSKL